MRKILITIIILHFVYTKVNYLIFLSISSKSCKSNLSLLNESFNFLLKLLDPLPQKSGIQGLISSSRFRVYFIYHLFRFTLFIIFFFLYVYIIFTYFFKFLLFDGQNYVVIVVRYHYCNQPLDL